MRTGAGLAVGAAAWLLAGAVQAQAEAVSAAIEHVQLAAYARGAQRRVHRQRIVDRHRVVVGGVYEHRRGRVRSDVELRRITFQRVGSHAGGAQLAGRTRMRGGTFGEDHRVHEYREVRTRRHDSNAWFPTQSRIRS